MTAGPPATGRRRLTTEQLISFGLLAMLIVFVIAGVSGAYTLALGSNYNLLPLPAVVLVADGDARPIRRRQTIADLLAWELDAGAEAASAPATSDARERTPTQGGGVGGG